MLRRPNASKLFLATLVAVALAGSIAAADAGSPGAGSDSMDISPKAIGDAQTILEQNGYLSPRSYRTGELDRTTITAIAVFQDAHALRQNGALDFDTTALLWTHARAPRAAVAAVVVPSPTYVYLPTVVYRPTAEPLFIDKKALILRGVEFDIDRATLRPGSLTTLDQVASSLKTWPEVMVEIQGHTSEPGTAIHNMDLSERRAESVRAYLVSQGIDRSRLVANGYGQTRFIADNSTAEGRQENRRVELHEIR